MKENHSTSLTKLLIYRNLLQDDLVRQLEAIITDRAEQSAIYELAAGLITKAEKLGLSGDLWRSYIIYLIARDENVFSQTAEKTRTPVGSGLRRSVVHDIDILKAFLQADLSGIDGTHFISDFTPSGANYFQDFTELNECFLGQNETAEQVVDSLAAYYSRHGCGRTAGYAAFRWEEEAGLIGIKNPDGICFEDIVGYEYQKDVLAKNTEAFLTGRPANNVLLVGARGTGKSSSVKALVSSYFASGLRLVEVPKHQLRHLNKILDTLRGRSQRFIVFLDDLSFEENETDYKYLKSTLDGGIEAKPDNVLVYATSNRRHLIQENWQDRAGGQDIHSMDAVHEKISLSDRFGIVLTYPAPDQTEYLRIVEAIARKHAVDVPVEELKRGALRWEMSHSGRSGRVAQQFIKHIMGNN